MEIQISKLIYILFKDRNEAQIIKSNVSDKEFVVPKTVQYEANEYMITSIGDNAFLKSKIENLSFAKDSYIKTIGNNAFQNSEIKVINLPASIEELKDYWCFQADNLNKITIDEKNTHFKYYQKEHGIVINEDNKEVVFVDRALSDDIDLPNDIIKVMPYSFSNCNIRSFSINSPFLEIIEPYSFYNCKKLETFTICETRELTLKENCFKSCHKLFNYTINCPLLTVNSESFSDCNSILEIKFEIPKIYFWPDPFVNCQNIDKITIINQTNKNTLIDASMIVLMDKCFQNFNKLKCVKIETNILVMGEVLFHKCPAITNLSINTKNMITVNLNLFNQLNALKCIDLSSEDTLSIQNSSLDYNTSLDVIKLKARKLEMDYNCFCYKQLSHVEINISEESIGFNPIFLKNIVSLRVLKIHISKSNYKFEKNFFTDHKKLETVEITAKMAIFKDECFSSSSCLKNFYVSARNIEFGNKCFKNCQSLHTFEVKDYNRLLIGSQIFEGCKKLDTLKIISKNDKLETFTTTLDESAFQNAQNLKSVDLCVKCINLQKKLFNYSNITSFTIACKKILISSGLFTESNLKQIVFRSNDLKISQNCFKNNDHLESVVFASKNIDIGQGCFSRNKNLGKILFENAENIIIGKDCFCGLDICKNLNFISRPSNLKKTQEPDLDKINNLFIYENSFLNCHNVETMSFNVRKALFIGKNCFNGLVRLTNIKISQAIDIKIDFKAFIDCPSRKSILDIHFVSTNLSYVQNLDSDKKMMKILPNNSSEQTFLNSRCFSEFYIIGINKNNNNNNDDDDNDDNSNNNENDDNSNNNENDNNKASIISYFPSTTNITDENVKRITQYCYPKGIKMVDNLKDKKNPEILDHYIHYSPDNNIYSKLIIVLQFYLPYEQKELFSETFDYSYPFSLCLISNNPDISLHFDFLNKIYSNLIKKPKNQCIEIIDSIPLENRIYGDMIFDPNCKFISIAKNAHSLSFLYPVLIEYYQKSYELYKEESLYILYPTMQILFDSIKPEYIAQLYLGLICNHPIKIISSDMTKLTYSICALINLIKCIKYRMTINTHIPSLEIFNDCPFPSIMGYHEQIQFTSFYSIVYNIDTETIEYQIPIHSKIIKNASIYDTLVKGMNNILSPKKLKFVTKEDFIDKINKIFEENFISQMISYISGCLHIEFNKVVFDETSFLNHYSGKDLSFMRVFIRGDVFIQFLEKIAADKLKIKNPIIINKSQGKEITKKSQKQRRYSYSQIQPKYFDNILKK